MAQTKTITIKWDNAVTIENVAQKKTELLKVFNSNQEIFLDISQLDDALSRAFVADGPYVIDCAIDKDELILPTLAEKVGD